MPPFLHPAWEDERPIDDGSFSLQNSAVARSFKFTLGGIDEVAGVARAWVKAVRSDGQVVLEL